MWGGEGGGGLVERKLVKGLGIYLCRFRDLLLRRWHRTVFLPSDITVQPYTA